MDILYCYGNGQTLWSVYNGIALIFGSKTFMNALLGVTAAVGGIWAITRTMYSANVGIFARTWFFPSFLIFNLAFLPNTTVNIVDQVSPTQRYMAVSNVPLGVAALPAMASAFSHVLTQKISQYLSPADTNARFTSTGDLFGAKFLTLAKDMRLSSPRSRSNIKHFVNRCFTWPYLYANVSGLKEQALHTDDVLGFIMAHPHNWCGSYWEQHDGETVFLSCREGALQTKTLLSYEEPFFASKLVNQMFGGSTSSASQTNKLKRLVSSSWEEMLGHQKNAFQVMDQFLMINAFREAKDDDREASGLTRLFPELVSFHGARAMAHQNMASLIKGDVAGSYVPMVHGAILSILIILFIFIVPMAFMPGGLQIFTTWVRLIFWVSLWPPFFAAFEALAASSLISATLPYAGLSIATHTGLTEAAFDSYAYFKASLLLVPVISWFVVSGSSYAITQFASSVTGSMSADAGRGASDAVDGNVSFDNQNFENRTVGSVSVGQQTLGPSVSFGSHLDTGGMSLTFDPTTGHVHGDHRVSQMQSNITATDSYASALNKELTEAQAATREKTISFEDAKSRQDTTSLAVAEEFAKQNVSIRGFTESQNHDASRLFEQARQTSVSGSSEKVKQDSFDTSSSVKAHAGISTDKTPLGRILGIDAGVSVETSASKNHSNSDIDRIARENNWSAADRNLFTSAAQNIKSGNVEARNEHSRSLVENHQASVENTQRAANDLRASETYSKNLATAKSLSERGEVNISRNFNDEVMDHIAKERFGGDKIAAHQWASQNDDSWVRLGTDYAVTRSETLFKKLRTNQDLSDTQVKSLFESASAEVSSKNVSQTLDMTARAAENGLDREDIKDKIARDQGNYERSFNISQDTHKQVEGKVTGDIEDAQNKIREKTDQDVDGRRLHTHIRNMNDTQGHMDFDNVVPLHKKVRE